MKIIFGIIIGLILVFGLFLLIPPTKTTAPSKNQEGEKTAQSKESPEATKTSNVVIKTDKGDIVLELYLDKAPKTVENFLSKARSGFYNGLTFHRVEDWVIQGGDPKGDGTGGGDQPTEINDLPFEVGSVGVARGGDIQVSNDAQFFITKKRSDWLDKQYTNFGKVIDGMDVVNKIEIGTKIISIEVNE